MCQITFANVDDPLAPSLLLGLWGDFQTDAQFSSMLLAQKDLGYRRAGIGVSERSMHVLNAYAQVQTGEVRDDGQVYLRIKLIGAKAPKAYRATLAAISAGFADAAAAATPGPYVDDWSSVRNPVRGQFSFKSRVCPGGGRGRGHVECNMAFIIKFLAAMSQFNGPDAPRTVSIDPGGDIAVYGAPSEVTQASVSRENRGQLILRAVREVGPGHQTLSCNLEIFSDKARQIRNLARIYEGLS